MAVHVLTLRIVRLGVIHFMTSPLAALANIIGNKLEHLVSCGDHLRVHLVGSLGGNHVDQLLNDLDIGCLHRTLLNTAQTGKVSLTYKRVTTGNGSLEQVVARGLPPLGINEIDESDLDEVSRSGLIIGHRRHSAVLTDGYFCGLISYIFGQRETTATRDARTTPTKNG